MGYVVSGENPIDWNEQGESGATAYRLFTSPTARVGQLAKLPAPVGCQYVYLFPGSRAMLIKARIDREPAAAGDHGGELAFPQIPHHAPPGAAD